MGFPTRLVLLLSAVALVGSSAPIQAAPEPEPLASVLADARSSSDNQSFRVYRWDLFPSILVLDTPDCGFQDRMFSRLAFFLEKRGYRGRLLDNHELERLHGWNAHDYGPEGLASFFNAAERAGVALNPEEHTLQEIALDQGILTTDRGQLAPGRGGILSISRPSSVYERRLFLTHESFHGVFFASAEYHDFCFKLWGSMSPGTKAFSRASLMSWGYDADYRYLCVNEFQAYLMQQPLRYASEYFRRVTRRFEGNGASVPVAGMLQAARRLSGFLESHYGIRAGGTVEVPHVAGGSG